MGTKRIYEMKIINNWKNDIIEEYSDLQRTEMVCVELKQMMNSIT